MNLFFHFQDLFTLRQSSYSLFQYTCVKIRKETHPGIFTDSLDRELLIHIIP
jgi:hypothetical protein